MRIVERDLEIGERDPKGNEVIYKDPQSGAQLWKQSTGKGYVVCIWPTDEEMLWAYRRELEDAKKLFKDVCKLFKDVC